MKRGAASYFTVHRIYREARKHVMRGKSYVGAEPSNLTALAQQQSQLRAVQTEFHRRLKRAGIHVEGATK